MPQYIATKEYVSDILRSLDDLAYKADTGEWLNDVDNDTYERITDHLLLVSRLLTDIQVHLPDQD